MLGPLADRDPATSLFARVEIYARRAWVPAAMRSPTQYRGREAVGRAQCRGAECSGCTAAAAPSPYDAMLCQTPGAAPSRKSATASCDLAPARTCLEAFA